MGRKWSQEQRDRLSKIMRARYAGEPMPPSYAGESLRGYGHPIYQRDNFTCRYCGADGTKSFEVWLTLTCDHLLPKGHPDVDKQEFIVTACNFCNVAENRYFYNAMKQGFSFDGKTPHELLELRREYVLKKRLQYKTFWEENVKPK